MKKVLLCFMMAFFCITAALAETDTKTYRTFVKNDRHVFFCSHRGITVVVDPTVGGIFEPHISIINESGRAFVFEPKTITAEAFAIPGNDSKYTRYRTERFLAKGDTTGMERDQLTIYTPEKYSKKVSRSMWWGSFLTELVVAGVESIGETDERQQFWNDVHREKRIDEAEAERHAEKRRISEGYWRANTIFADEEHEGFIAIKHVSTKYLLLNIPVDGETFHFIIDAQKHY
ncbi:hypothetical protein [Prevotella sp. MA2016]|uniref:hypothetical protein n=1 Tax=Prevotella sp. MA2016 TaxID=1408310 RepID=UPI00048B3258|nr:hypothetical protein [Prevotella sp. MA2016]